MYLKSHMPIAAVAIMILAVAFLSACGSDGDPVTPGIEPEIINSTDTFQFQTTGADNYTGTLRYTWSNTGTMANVDQSCSISSGNAVLALLDANGDSVYESSLDSDGSFPSSAGVDGDWTVEVRCFRVDGNLNFRLEKRTP